MDKEGRRLKPSSFDNCAIEAEAWTYLTGELFRRLFDARLLIGRLAGSASQKARDELGTGFKMWQGQS